MANPQAILKFLLEADISNFTAGFDAAEKKAGKFTDGINGPATKALIGYAAAAASAALGINKLLKAFDEADELVKQADRLGIATDKLAGLQLAAEKAGTGQETLTKALRDSSRLLAENGTEVQQWTSRLGLSIKDLRSQSPDELFRTYAGAIGDLDDRGQQFAATAALMGGKSQDLTGLIIKGSAAIDEAQALVVKYGVALTEVEYAQIEAVKDSFEKADLAAKGAANTIAIAFAPVIEEVVNSLVDAVGGSVEFKAAMQTAAETGYVAFKLLGNAIDALQGIFQKAAQTSYEFSAGLLDLIGADGIAASFRQSADEWGQAARDNFANLKTIEDLRAEFSVLVADSEARAAEAVAQREALRRQGLGKGTDIATAPDGFSPDQFATGDISNEQALRDAKEIELAIEAEYNNYSLQEQQRYNNEMLQMRRGVEGSILELVNDRIAQEIFYEQAKHANVAELAFDLIDAVAVTNKKVAKLQKALAIAQVIWTTGVAIMKFLSTQNYAGAAAAAVMGATQLARIKAANYGGSEGGGGGARVNTGDFSASRSADNQTGQIPELAGAVQGRAVNVYIEGNNIAGPESARWIADTLADLVNNSDYLIFNGQSRQAQELRAAAEGT